MTWNYGPQNINSLTSFTIPNPGSGSTAYPNAFQISNSSPFLLVLQAGSLQITVQPYTIQTVPIPEGQSGLLVDPILNAYPGLTSGYITGTWYSENETSILADGPLTSAATIAAITGSVQTASSLDVLNANATHSLGIGFLALNSTALHNYSGLIVAITPVNVASVNIELSVQALNITSGLQSRSYIIVPQEDTIGAFGSSFNAQLLWLPIPANSGDSLEVAISTVLAITPSEQIAVYGVGGQQTVSTIGGAPLAVYNEGGTQYAGVTTATAATILNNVGPVRLHSWGMAPAIIAGPTYGGLSMTDGASTIVDAGTTPMPAASGIVAYQKGLDGLIVNSPLAVQNNVSAVNLNFWVRFDYVVRPFII